MPLSVLIELGLPFVFAGVVGALVLWTRRPASPESAAAGPQRRRWREIVLAASLAGALALMHRMIVGRFVWPPPGLTERLLPMFGVAGLGGGLAAFLRRGYSSAVAAFITGAASVSVAIWPMLAGPPDENRLIPWTIVPAAGALAALSAVCLAAMQRRSHPLAAAMILAGMGFAVGAALLGAGSMKLGQFGLGVGAAALGFLLALATARRICGPQPGSSGGLEMGVFTAGMAVLAALLVAGNRYGELRILPAWLFALPAPVALAVPACMPRRIGPRTTAAAAVLAAAIVAGLAAGLAVDLPDDARSTEADDYGYGP